MTKRYNRFYLVVIADYNDDDAHGIVHDNLYYWFDENDLGIVDYDRVDVSAFNTVETGYMLSRRALNPLSPSRRQVFFVNTAPRMDDLRHRATNQGEHFVWAELRNGKQVFAVNSGHTLSFIKPEIAALRTFHIPDNPEDIPMLVDAFRSASGGQSDGSVGIGQFRSGFVYPIVVAQSLAARDEAISPRFNGLLGAPFDATRIPNIPADAVVFRDGYGNLKTSIAPAGVLAAVGKFAVVTCNGQEIVAHVTTAMFDVPLYHFSLAPGSTVLAYSNGTRLQFAEIALRGGRAAKVLGQPSPGDPISWRLADEADLQRLGYAADGTPPPQVLQKALRP